MNGARVFTLLVQLLFWPNIPLPTAGWQLVDELCDSEAFARGILPRDWCSATVYRCRWQNITCDADNELLKLELYDVPLNSALPETIDAPGPNVHTLRLVNCGLSGPVPHTLSSVTTLRVLDLSNNALEGEWTAWPLVAGQLEQFSIANNRLGGKTFFNSLTFPHQWRNMTHFNIANNSFVEDWLSLIEPYWPAMRYFNIENNRFCGTAPTVRRAYQYRIAGNFFSELERSPDPPPPFDSRIFSDCDMSRVPFRPPPDDWLKPFASQCRYRYDPSNKLYSVNDLTTTPTTTKTTATKAPALPTAAATASGGGGGTSATLPENATVLPPRTSVATTTSAAAAVASAAATDTSLSAPPPPLLSLYSTSVGGRCTGAIAIALFCLLWTLH